MTRAALNTLTPQRRQQAVEDAREAGKCGATRVPDTVLFGYGDPSDTLVLDMTAALLDGRQEREEFELSDAVSHK